MSQQHCYHVTYLAFFDARVSQGGQAVTLNHALNYASDLDNLSAWIKQQSGANDVMLLSWRSLKGEQRPAEEMPEAAPAVAPQQLLGKQAVALAQFVAVAVHRDHPADQKRVYDHLAELCGRVIEGNQSAAAQVFGYLQAQSQEGRLSQDDMGRAVLALETLKADAEKLAEAKAAVH